MEKLEKRKRISEEIKAELKQKQNMWCANKDCKTVNGKRQKIDLDSQVDHIIPRSLWNLKGMKGDSDNITNLQILCPKCHVRKSRKDDADIAKYKREHGITTKAKKKKAERNVRVYPPPIDAKFGSKSKLVPKSEATELRHGKRYSKPKYLKKYIKNFGW